MAHDIDNPITRDLHTSLIAWANPAGDKSGWLVVKLSDAGHRLTHEEFAAHLRQLQVLGLYMPCGLGYGFVRARP
jgi:hypothetical protein